MSGKHLALIVDDDRDILEEVGSMVASLGHEFKLACNQEETLALLGKHNFCYVLLDLELKQNAKSIKAKIQTGFNILTQIREQDGELPVIIMTAHGKAHELTVRAFKMGATDYIKKPFDEEEEPLEDKIRDAMSKTCEANYAVCPNLADKGRPIKHKIVLRSSSVEIDGIKVMSERSGKTRQVFDFLCEQFLRDAAAKKPADEYEGITGSRLAESADWDEMSIRQAIKRLRKRIQDKVKKEKGIAVGTNDIIENTRQWKGYRINPKTVIISSE